MGEKLKVLLLMGGAEYHNLRSHRAALRGLLEEPFALTFCTDLGDLDLQAWREHDCIVNYTTLVEPAPAQAGALLAAVHLGTGLVALHGGTITFRNVPGYARVLGGQTRAYVSYQPFPVHIVRGAGPHPITAGLADFQIEDELYIVEGDPTRWRILAHAEGRPVLYTTSWGRGRVVVNTLGHDSAALNNPNFQTLLTRSIEWAAVAKATPWNTSGNPGRNSRCSSSTP